MIFEPIPTTEKPERKTEKDTAFDTARDVAAEAKARSVADDVAALKPAHRYDVHIWGVYIMLCIISMVELYSASSREISATNIYAPLLRHVMHLLTGFFIIVALQRVHYRKFFAATPWIVFGSLVAMVYTLINGDYITGAKRSFSIVIMRVQPAEFLKFSAVLLVAYVLCKSSRPDRRHIESWRVSLCAAVVGIFGGLLFFQGLTNTLLLMAISLSMMFVASVSWKKMGIILLVFGMLGGIGYIYKKVTLKDADKPKVEQVGPNGG
ncbi:MAG: FtsW/RodA/SpoVE family cell cycle protein, partial [Muribaculaceae bacterium]|nr:FtsW/RodA/SpoVE family cell cycle protein [Muribaculaceae bacterium]